jgi:hypothetical protein
VGLVYNPTELSGVMTARPRVAGVLKIASESTLTVLRARTGQLRRIRWHTGQGRVYVCMVCESFRRDTI